MGHNRFLEVTVDDVVITGRAQLLHINGMSSKSCRGEICHFPFYPLHERSTSEREPANTTNGSNRAANVIGFPELGGLGIQAAGVGSEGRIPLSVQLTGLDTARGC